MYFSVPNWAANIGDLLVAEHTNHFTDVSIRRVVHEAGLAVDVLNSNSLPYAFAVVCRVSEGHRMLVKNGIKASVDHARAAASALQRACVRIDTEFSSRHKRHSAVFGAGFYGAFLLARMPDRSAVACCIDNNPHLWGKTLFGVPVASPEMLPTSTEIVYVGLNPARARELSHPLELCSGRGLTSFISKCELPRFFLILICVIFPSIAMSSFCGAPVCKPCFEARATGRRFA